jgi:hypothetical protein
MGTRWEIRVGPFLSADSSVDLQLERRAPSGRPRLYVTGDLAFALFN